MKEKADLLHEKMQGFSKSTLLSELDRQIQTRFDDVLAGVKSLDGFRQQRENAGPKPVLWQEGSTSLLDYSTDQTAQQAPVILFVPSLINRSYILDISPKRSFMGHLGEQGYRPLLVNWDDMDESETNFTIDDYIYRINRMISYVNERFNGPLFIAGYCMGGLLALASTLTCQCDIRGIAFFATPWNYHADDFPRVELQDQAIELLSQSLKQAPYVSGNVLQAIFYYLHPHMVSHKYEALLSSSSQEREEMLALEHWVNDGIPMTHNVWYECFVRWAHHNDPATGKWCVGDKMINPQDLNMPSFFCLPQKDKIVPPACAKPLSQLCNNPTIITPHTGHVGIVAGKHAKRSSWNPFCQWLEHHR